MNKVQLDALRELASSFRRAIERARVDRAPGALPYFPDGACRLTSRLFAQYLARRPDSTAFGHSALPFGQPEVIVGSRTSFHQSLTDYTAQDARDALTALTPDESARLTRQLAAIEARLASSDSPEQPER